MIFSAKRQYQRSIINNARLPNAALALSTQSRLRQNEAELAESSCLYRDRWRQRFQRVEGQALALTGKFHQRYKFSRCHLRQINEIRNRDRFKIRPSLVLPWVPAKQFISRGQPISQRRMPATHPVIAEVSIVGICSAASQTKIFSRYNLITKLAGDQMDFHRLKRALFS